LAMPPPEIYNKVCPSTPPSLPALFSLQGGAILLTRNIYYQRNAQEEANVHFKRLLEGGTTSYTRLRASVHVERSTFSVSYLTHWELQH